MTPTQAARLAPLARAAQALSIAGQAIQQITADLECEVSVYGDTADQQAYAYETSMAADHLRMLIDNLRGMAELYDTLEQGARINARAYQ